MRDDPAGIPGGADRGSPPEPHPDPHPDPVAERSDLSALVMDHELAAEVVIDVDEGIPPAKGSPMSGGAVKVAAIVGTQALLAGLFWVVAARVVSTSQLGTGAALYASLQFVNYLTGMGLTTTLARFGAQRGRESDRWFGWSVLVTSGASAIGTLAYLGLVSSSSTNLLRTGAGGYALFFALTAGTSIGLLVDVRLIAAQAWGWLTAKVVVIGLARFPLAFVHAPGNRAVWVLVVIAAPQALIGVLAALALPVAIGTGAGLRVPREWRPGVRFSFVNWIAVLATQAPLFVLPLIVALRVPAAQNAQFYLAWSLTAAVSLVPGAIAQVVLVEGSRNDHRFRQQAAKATSVAVRLSGLALAGSFVLALLITTLYGPGYRLTAEILPPLVAASVPWSIAAIRLSEARLRFDHVTTVAVTVCLGGGIIALGFALVVALGAKGAVIAWDAGNVLAAALAIALGRSRWSPGRHAARGRRRGGLAQPPAG